MPTIQQIISAEFGFAQMKDLLFKLYTHPSVDSIMDKVRLFILEASPFILFAILVLIGAGFAFFGKRYVLIPAILVGVCAFAYVGGVAYLTPKINGIIGAFFPLDSMIVGIVLAVIAGILFIPIYFFGIVGVGIYATYLLIYPVCLPMFGMGISALVGLAFGVGVAIFIFLFRKWFEMGGTALLGGYIIMLGINCIILLPLTLNYMLWGAVTLAGVIIQVKFRKRF